MLDRSGEREEKTHRGRWCSVPDGHSLQPQTLCINRKEERAGCNADSYSQAHKHILIIMLYYYVQCLLHIYIYFVFFLELINPYSIELC